MIPNDHAIMMYKFSENQWINKLIQGEVSFSCAGAFIIKAKNTGNIVQGDELEGVFARQHINSPTIELMRKKLGNDLEEIQDGDYVFLRRKSSKLKPIFCWYAYTAEDAVYDGKPNVAGKQKVKLEFDERLFEGFASESIGNVISDDHRFTMILLQPKPFIDKIKLALSLRRYAYQMHPVKYIDIHEEEFFIEPTEEYPELFIKSNEYYYQHEARICITSEKFNNVFQRNTLLIGKFNIDDYNIVHSRIYVEFEADFRINN